MKVFILFALFAAAAAQQCSPSQFECTNGNCIPASYQCDYDNDCGDLSDEMGCPCEDDDFVCGNTVCIPGYWECDKYADCDDGSDEKDCPCATGEVKCPITGQCIKEEYWCDADGIWDCNEGEDQSDEFCSGNGNATDIIDAPRRIVPSVTLNMKSKMHEVKARRARLGLKF